MKHLIVALACILGAAIIYGFWLYNESLRLERQGYRIPYTELLERDISKKREAVSSWLNH